MNYSIIIDQLETKIYEASSEEEAVALFLKGLTLKRLLSMIRVQAEAGE